MEVPTIITHFNLFMLLYLQCDHWYQKYNIPEETSKEKQQDDHLDTRTILLWI